MTGVLEDAPDVLRQLQKLSKELGPVKTALAALAKRENAHPNPQAAAASLEKVAHRVADVTAKYTSFMARMGRLAERDVPATITLTTFMAAPATQIAADVEALRKKEDVRREKGRGRRGPSSWAGPTEDSADDNDDTNAEEEEERGAPRQRREGKATPPASLLSNVCPSDIPFLVPPEYYQQYHDQMQLRVEMVEYLLATGRTTTARHVAEGYGLPLVWFPSLAAEAMLANAEGGANGSGAAAGSPAVRNGSVASASFLSSGSPLITPAMQPRSGGVTGSNGNAFAGVSSTPAGMTSAGAPVSPLVIHSSPPLAIVAASRHSPPRVGTQAFLDDASSDATPPPPPQQQQQEEGRVAATPMMMGGSASSPTLRHTVPTSSPTPALFISAAAAAEEERRRRRVMPDLVARVVSAALFLKDEYFDRMVLERLIHNSGFAPAWEEDVYESQRARRGNYNTRDGTQQVPIVRASNGVTWRPPHFLPPVTGAAPGHVHHQQQQQQQQADRHLTVMERDLYEEAVVETARRVTRSHVCTQSGSTQFDDAMMNVIEELLATTLDQHDKKTHNSGDPAEGPREPIRRSSRPLTPDELLAAEDAFSSDVLFIKRPTRYYCVHTTRTMEGSGEGGTFPRVLPNGMVIADSAVAHELASVRACVEGDRLLPSVRVGVVCPPSDALFSQSELQRIFVT